MYELKAIDSVKINNDRINVESKRSGFNMGGVYRGKFKLKKSNKIYHLYVNTNYSDNLYIYLNDENVIIYNSKDVNEINEVI